MALQSVCIKGMASVTLLSKTATNTMTTKTTRTATKTKGGALPAERVDVDVARVARSEWS